MRPLSVLYVDDDPDIRTIVRMALSLDPGIALAEAQAGEAALALVAGGIVPDIALIDVTMPGMTGLMLMDRLHSLATTKSLPVVVMTAKARSADIALYHAQGAIGVITKPFDPLSLAARVRALAEGGGAA